MKNNFIFIKMCIEAAKSMLLDELKRENISNDEQRIIYGVLFNLTKSIKKL